MKLTVAQLAEEIGAELVGDGSAQISSVGVVDSAGPSTIAFVSSGRHKARLGDSGAAAVIVSKRIEESNKPQLVVENVDAALIQALNIFAPKLKRPAEGIDPTAKVGQDVKIGRGASIGPDVVIGDKVQIGENTIIGSGCKIGENSKTGKNCRLDSNVVVYHNCCLGDNVVIQANSTIGSVGFGYSFVDGAHKHIPHNGIVVIEDFVEIGANCCVDRAKFGETRIGAGTKIDNLVQIAHNVVIGKCCLIVAQVGISGSCKIGNGVVIAGQVGLKDHIEVGDGAVVGAKSGVMGNIEAGKTMLGIPAIDGRTRMRHIALMQRLPEMFKQLRELVKKVERIEAAKDDKK